MIVLGMTGPSGGGKGTVGAAFSAHAIPVLDTDAVYHEWIAKPSPCVDELVEAFGKDVLDAQGGIDRHSLAAIVFCGGEEQKKRLDTLNSISHRYVLESCHFWLNEQEKMGKKIAVLDAPLLIEAGLHRCCHKVIVVLAPVQLRLARIMMRDGLSEAAGMARITAQPKDDFYRMYADFVFVNEGDITAADVFVRDIINRLPAA